MADNGGEGSSKAPGKKAATRAPKKGNTAAEDEGQESEGEGDEVPDAPNAAEIEASDNDSVGSDYEGEIDVVNDEGDLDDFVVRDSDVEAEMEEGAEEEEAEIDDLSRPTDGIERSPDQEPQNDGFNIVRLVQYTDKAGEDLKCPINVDADYFTIQYGALLLDLSDLNCIEEVHVRNYWGQERFVPRRMLVSINRPWGLPTTIKIDEDRGIGLPVAFVGEIIPAMFGGGVEFDKFEVVMIKADGDPTTVIDFERRVGKIAMRAPKLKKLATEKGKEPEESSDEEEELLASAGEFPWDLHVDRKWIDKWVLGKIPKPRGKGKGKGKDDDDNGGEGPSKRKRDDEGDEGDDEQPRAKPKKRATLTAVPKDATTIPGAFATKIVAVSSNTRARTQARRIRIARVLAANKLAQRYRSPKQVVRRKVSESIFPSFRLLGGLEWNGELEFLEL